MTAAGVGHVAKGAIDTVWFATRYGLDVSRRDRPHRTAPQTKGQAKGQVMGQVMGQAMGQA